MTAQRRRHAADYEPDVELGGHVFRIRLLSAFEQFRLLQVVRPHLGALQSAQAAVDLRGNISRLDFLGLWQPMTTVEDAALDRVVDACLGACECRENEDWRPAAADDFDLPNLLTMLREVVYVNLGPFLTMKRPSFFRAQSDLQYQSVSLDGDLDWVLEPVVRGMCSLAQLHDGSVHIEDLALANDALAVRAENEARALRAAEKARR